MDQNIITRIVEAALLAANQPLTLAQLHALFPEDQPAPNGSVEQALETLRDGCEERGVELIELASGFRYQVKADVHAWVARLWTERQTRYTRATLETLALIAYRQPITRGEIEQVRGVAVNSNIIKALEEREWIRVVGHRDVPGKPALFGTTKAFLDYFGLKRLDELPPLSELKDIGELEPQLQFDNVLTDPTPIEAGGIASEVGVEILDASDEASNDEAGNDETVAADETTIGDSTKEDPETDDSATGESASDEFDSEEPEAAPGERAADENEKGSESISSDNPSAYAETGQEIDSDPFSAQDNAVETTTVPMTDDDAEALSEQASSEQEEND
ncbi:MAG TPA: SMC-Scp complex subunit ScpB [Lysobacter sp.]|jgi:segregation and condensation protein B|nr:SMC-Scp complex subunit ScpB [Lysobacter sp.]